MSQGFCTTGQLQEKCKRFTFREFPKPKGVIVLLLEYFKVGLPMILEEHNYTDYYDKPFRVDPKDIDLMPPKDYGKNLVILAMTDDSSTYSDDKFEIEETEYVFQVELRVVADRPDAAFENMLALSSAVKTLLVNMEDNINLMVEIGDFSLLEFDFDELNQTVRNGLYRFSIQQKNFKQ